MFPVKSRPKNGRRLVYLHYCALCCIVLVLIFVQASWSANTLYGKFETNIPRNESVRPRSQFIHSCVCERFIQYITTIDLSILQYVDLGIYKLLTDT